MYDGDGQRVQKIACPGSTVPCTAAVSGAQVTTFAYDAAGNLAGEYTSTPAAAPSGCGTATCYVTVDQIGSTRMVTDSNGNVVRRYDFLPFGEELWAGVGGRTNAQGYQSGQDYFNPKFTGQYRDVESRLDYFNARYYSPEQGRFLSPDPGNAGADPGDPQTWNGYAYVGNNPLSYTDPSGMCETCIGAATGNPILIGIGAVIDLGLLLDGIFGGGGPSTIPPALATPSGPVLGPASDDIWNEQIPGQGSGSITTGGVFGSGNTSPFVFSLQQTVPSLSQELQNRIIAIARTWVGVPYKLGGKNKQGADCSGSVWCIYNEAGLPYKYLQTSQFKNSCSFVKLGPNQAPETGDVGVYPGHVVILDPKAGPTYTGAPGDVWSAFHTNGPTFGPAQQKWFPPGAPDWYRYNAKGCQ